MVNIGMFCVFFSSRRRHTRCSRDWSSDVCSSDLNDDAADHDESAYVVRPYSAEGCSRRQVPVPDVYPVEALSEHGVPGAEPPPDNGAEDGCKTLRVLQDGSGQVHVVAVYVCEVDDEALGALNHHLANVLVVLEALLFIKEVLYEPSEGFLEGVQPSHSLLPK